MKLERGELLSTLHDLYDIVDRMEKKPMPNSNILTCIRELESIVGSDQLKHI